MNMADEGWHHGLLNFLTPDIILPSQTIDSGRLSGEQRLILEVLQSAVDDIKLGLDRPERLKSQIRYNEAIAWVDGASEAPLFDFELACWALSIDPEWLRNGIHAKIAAVKAGGAFNIPRTSPHGAGYTPKLFPARVREKKRGRSDTV
jgi:hypothetical protein